MFIFYVFSILILLYSELFWHSLIVHCFWNPKLENRNFHNNFSYTACLNILPASFRHPHMVASLSSSTDCMRLCNTGIARFFGFLLFLLSFVGRTIAAECHALDVRKA